VATIEDRVKNLEDGLLKVEAQIVGLRGLIIETANKLRGFITEASRHEAIAVQGSERQRHKELKRVKGK